MAMRVGVDCTVVGRPQTGFETCVLGLASALVRLRSEVEFVFFVPRPIPAQLAPLQGQFSAVTSPFGTRVLANQAWLASILRGGLVDLMHYPAFPPLVPPARFVLTVHDATPWLFPRTMQWKSRIYFRSSVRFWGRRSRLIITPSEASKAQIVRRLRVPAERVRVVGWGVRDELRAPGSPQDGEILRRFGIGPGPGYMLCVGTVEPRKNLAVAVRALARLREKGAPRHLLIVGRLGWGVTDLQRVVEEERVRDLVHLAGHISDEHLISLYKHASFLVQPSLLEGFGLPILEAMALGCPVIASDIAAHVGVLGDAGLYFAPSDVDGLAQAMARLLSGDPARVSMIGRGLRRSEEFTWAEVARRTLQVYREAAGART